MKVIEAISDTNIGGAGRLLLARLRHSDREKIRTTVLLPRHSMLKEYLTDLRVTCIELDGCADVSFAPRVIPNVAAMIQSIRPDLINCHGCFHTRVAAMLCRVPIRLYTRHCVYPLTRWQSSAAMRHLTAYASPRLSHGVIAVAEVVRRDLLALGVPRDRIVTIINGAEALPLLSEGEKQAMRKSIGIAEDSIVVGINARLEPCKGHRYFLAAANRLVGISDRFRFLIIGGGSLESSLRRVCRQGKLNGKVIMTGYVPDVAPWMNLVNINVNCSVGTETSSLALSEGMSLGIPAVVSDYGGNPYMVKHGVNGLVYPQKDAEALARAILQMAFHPGQYQKMSAAARQRFDTELNAAAMTRKTEELYLRMMKNRCNINRL